VPRSCRFARYRSRSPDGTETRKRPTPRQRLWLHIVLLLATFCSTTVVGARMQFNFLHQQPVFSLADGSLDLFPVGWILQHPANLLLGIPFSLTLMFILLAHEMGHYLYCRRYHVYATLPFFVPFPSLIGTMGAFIRIKSPIRSRSALFDIGIAGPIAGFIPSCVALFVGLRMSQPAGMIDASDIQIGFPLLFHLAARWMHIGVPLSSLSLHPIAAAAWVGMFATALNLLPGGQLDGGHILYALLRKYARFISTFLLVAAIVVVATDYKLWGWSIMLILLLIMGPKHPPTADDDEPLGWFRYILGWLTLAFILIGFTPYPFIMD